MLPYHNKIGLFLLLALSQINASASPLLLPPHPEYTAAFNVSEFSDRIVVNGYQVLARTAYKPLSPDLAEWAEMFGEQIRFVHLPNMSTQRFETYVANMSSLVDDLVRRDPSVRRQLVAMSNNTANIDLSKFRSGRTVLALVPDIDPISSIYSTEKIGITHLAAVKSVTDVTPHHARLGLAFDAPSGAGTPNAIIMNREAINNHLSQRYFTFPITFPEPNERTIDNVLANLSDDEIVKRFRNNHDDALRAFQLHNSTLTNLAQQIGHASTAYRGRTVPTHDIPGRAGSDGRVLSILRLLDKAENVWFGHFAGRKLTLRTSTTWLALTGLRGTNHHSLYAIKPAEKYHGIRYQELMQFIRNEGNIRAKYPYLPEYPTRYQHLLRETANAWEDSLYLQGARKTGLSKEGIADYLNSLTRTFNSQCSI